MNEKIGSGRDENRVPLYKVVSMKVPFSIGIGTSDFAILDVIIVHNPLV